MRRAAIGAMLGLVLWTGRSTAFTGVATDVPIASLTGWTQCHLDSYSAFTPLSSILSACDGDELLLACRLADSPILEVAAHAPRSDVLFDTGQSDVPHVSNGVGWYFSSSWSWGFAPAGDPIDRNSCDVVASSAGPPGPNADERLCWHTAGNVLTTGWRCGAADFLGVGYERLIYQSTNVCGDGVIGSLEGCDDGNTLAGDGCDPGCRVECPCTCSGSPSTCTCPTIVPVAPRKFVVTDRLAAASKAQVVFVAKDAGVAKGPGTDPTTIGATFTAAYEDSLATGSFLLPAGDPGWLSNWTTSAKYVNRLAPVGVKTKVGQIKPGRLLRLVGKGLGDVPLDVRTAGPPTGSVFASYCIDNAGDEFCHCSELPTCVWKPIATGTGAKLTCRGGVGDPACTAICPPTTTTTSTSTSSSTSSTSSTSTSTSSTSTSTTRPCGNVFLEDFSNHGAGWTLEGEWEIGSATASFLPPTGFPDPDLDVSPTPDDGIAGAVIGGTVSTALHDFYFLTSPVIDASAVTPPLQLTYWRWLNSDYPPFMTNVVEVFDGGAWVTLWQGPPGTIIADSMWTDHAFDITPYANPNLRVRFGYNVGNSGAFTVTGWNLDEVRITDANCVFSEG